MNPDHATLSPAQTNTRPLTCMFTGEAFDIADAKQRMLAILSRGWCKGKVNEYYGGEPVRVCLSGALDIAKLHGGLRFEVQKRLLSRCVLPNGQKATTLAQYNDARGVGHADIVRLIETAL